MSFSNLEWGKLAWAHQLGQYGGHGCVDSGTIEKTDANACGRGVDDVTITCISAGIRYYPNMWWYGEDRGDG